jgi:DNA polymerase-3 subunit delta
MPEVKGAAAERFVGKPDPKFPIILLHGPDRGRVQMRAQTILKALQGPHPDPMALVELDPAVLDSDPSRLAEEADSVPMFGGSKTIFVRMDDPKILTKPLESLLKSPPTGANILIAAGDLKKSHPLRSRIEKSSTGAAIACYAADRRDIASLLTQIVEQFDLSINANARDQILDHLGADHALSAREIEKLCLYARKDGAITLDHVEAMLVDSSTHGMNDISDHAFAGQRDAALETMTTLLSEGMDASVIAQSLIRQGQMLERLRIDIDQGASPESAMSRVRPMIFFKRRPRIEAALRNWSSHRLRACIAYLDGELAELRLNQLLKPIKLERLILRIASEAARRR